MKFSLAVNFCSYSHYVPLALAAEEGLWNSINVADGLFFYEEPANKYPYTADGERYWHGKTHFPDPFVMVGAMAAVTKRIEFFTNVLKLPVRNPYLTAKQALTTSCISEGRFGLGVGLSPWQDDYTVCNQEWSTRGARCEEMIDIIKLMATGDMVEFHGKHYDMPRMQIAPVPKPPQKMPIYIGGSADVVLKRCARMTDGWVSVNYTFEHNQEIIAKLKQFRKEFDKENEPFEIKVLATDIADMDGFKRLRDLGTTEAVVMPQFMYGGDPRDVNYKIDAAKRFSDEVIAKFN